MNIQNNCVVGIDYTLTDKDGTVVDTTLNREPLLYLHGAANLLPGMEKALEGKTEGDKFKLTLNPEEGFGVRDEALMHRVPTSDLEHIEGLKEGSQIQAQSETGNQIYTVILIENDEITLDGNHPLAGVTLNFDIDVKSVRAATTEEIEHRQANVAEEN